MSLCSFLCSLILLTLALYSVVYSCYSTTLLFTLYSLLYLLSCLLPYLSLLFTVSSPLFYSPCTPFSPSYLTYVFFITIIFPLHYSVSLSSAISSPSFPLFRLSYFPLFTPQPSLPGLFLSPSLTLNAVSHTLYRLSLPKSRLLLFAFLPSFPVTFLSLYFVHQCLHYVSSSSLFSIPFVSIWPDFPKPLFFPVCISFLYIFLSVISTTVSLLFRSSRHLTSFVSRFLYV